MMKILVIEEDQLVLAVLTDALENHGYLVDAASTTWDGWELAIAHDYHLILLNTRLAGLGSIHLCRQLRSQGYQQPILLLVSDASKDGVAGLDAGADDYVIKPYKLPELMARIRALLRRHETTRPGGLLRWGELCLNSTSAEVTYREQPLSLTPKEFGLLELFLHHPQQVFSRTVILDRLWGLDALPHESTVTNHIKELRQRLKAAGMTTDLIETVYGLGYRLKPVPKAVSSLAEPQPTQLHPGQSQPDQPLVNAVIETSAATPVVWVIDDDPVILSTLSYLLQPWGVQVVELSDSIDLWKELAIIAPDLLILGLELSSSKGFDLCRRIRQHVKWRDLPILVLTACTDAETIQQMFAAGADDFVSKPLVGLELVTRVVSRLEQRRSAALQSIDPLVEHHKHWGIEKTTPKPLLVVSQGSVQDTYGNILLVDDEPNNLRVLSHILRTHGYKVRQALSGATALETIHAQPPDLIMLDVRMPNMDGYEVCATLKAQAATRNIPIVFLSALDDTLDKLKAFALGGVDYITKPFQAEEVLVRIKNQLLILQQQRQLREQNRQLQKEIQGCHKSLGNEIISYY